MVSPSRVFSVDPCCVLAYLSLEDEEKSSPYDIRFLFHIANFTSAMSVYSKYDRGVVWPRKGINQSIRHTVSMSKVSRHAEEAADAST